MKKSIKYSPEVRERAVRMVFEHRAEHESQWAAAVSIAGKDRLHCADLAYVGAPAWARHKAARRPKHG